MNLSYLGHSGHTVYIEYMFESKKLWLDYTKNRQQIIPSNWQVSPLLVVFFSIKKLLKLFILIYFLLNQMI